MLSLLIGGATACLRFENAYTKLPPGPWRAVLLLDPSAITPNPKGKPLDDKLNLNFDEVTNGELPFNFEVIYSDDTTFHLAFVNGEERIIVKDVSFGRSRNRAKDSIRINFPIYDTYLVGLYEDGLIEGEYVVNYRDNYRIPFIARFGMDHRFTKIPHPTDVDLTGNWKVTFGPGGDETEPFPAVGEFVQEGNQLSGTFRTETGDYRYLSGEISGDKAYLSVFDGAHAFLFEARYDASTDQLVGSFRSGTHYRTIWQAERDDKVDLASPMELTKAIDESAAFNFRFPNAAGDTISLNDEAFAGKVKLVQLMGTWCPNCREETAFLLDYLAANAHPDLEVISIGFERYRNPEKALAALTRFKENLQIPYPVLWGGYYDKAEATQRLAGLDKIISYPTLLFIDRNNRIRKVHTGYNGVATSKFEEFEQQFSETLEQLLNEKQVLQ